MFSTSNLNRLALSMSTAAITVIGTFSPITSPVVAQQARCVPPTPIGGRPISQAPADVRVAAQTAANAATNPDTKLTVFDTEREDGVTIYEFNGRQNNGCQLEIDALRPNKIEEIEKELPVLAQVPLAVRNRLKQQLPNFKVTFIEQSTRPQPQARPFPPIEPSAVLYELEGTCTATNPIPGPNPGNYCKAGQTGEATISENGTVFEFEVAS